MKIEIPGREALQLNHLVLDFNGTIAIDGVLIDGVPQLLHTLSENFQVHVITADTFGTVGREIKNIQCQMHIIEPMNQSQQKADYVTRLGKENVVAIGNGRNDLLMLQTAILGIAVLQKEGAHASLLSTADVICLSIIDALALLTNPLRLIATLRN